MAHTPVLLNQVLSAFADGSLDLFLDGTVGAGGHAAALLEAHPEIRCYLGLDQDPTALALATKNLAPWREKVELQRRNFVDLEEALAGQEADGILLDIGVSSMQLDTPERGFSFRYEAPLDMRMDPEGTLTAEMVVNTWAERDLARLFRDWGEEPSWRLAARVIVEDRPFYTTLELANLLDRTLRGKPGIHPATRVFQALRICVNRELEVLQNALNTAIRVLKPGGRIAVISFHSLEDRIVKDTFRHWAADKVSSAVRPGLFLDKAPLASILTKKPLEASENEIANNPRARSAKLRVATSTR